LNDSVLDGLSLLWIGTSVVFLVLIILLISINILTFLEKKIFQKESKKVIVTNKENGDSLLEIAAAIAVSFYKKSKNSTNEIAAAVAVSLFENNKSKASKSTENTLQSSWITINRSRMMQKKFRRI